MDKDVQAYVATCQTCAHNKESEKSAPHCIGPFKVLRRINLVASCQGIPCSMRRNPTSHASRLKPILGNSLAPTTEPLRRRHSHPRSRSHVSSNLIYPPLLSQTQRVVAGGLWNCQSAVRKADFISALASHYSFDFLALTETWISPKNTATPAALSSAYTFSHSPRESGRGGGTGSVTSPINLFIIVIYRPPGPRVLGDFNLPSDKLHSSGLLALLNSFSLSFNSCPPTHKKGNVLDLVFTHPFPATDMTVTPLHISNHHLVSFTITLPVLPKHNSQHLSLTRRNLHSISPSSVASCTLSSLPDHESFSSLPLDSATDTLLSSLSSTMDLLCPLSTIRKENSSTAPWLSDVLRNNRRELRSAARKWKKSKLDTDLISYRTLLSKFSLDVTSAKTSYYKENLETSAQDPRKLHNISSSLLNPPAPPSPSSLTAEDFATFYTETIERICQTFTSLPTSPTSHSQHFATPSLTQLSTVASEEVLQITRSCNPTTCPLDPIPSAMLQIISPDLLPFITTVINGSLTSAHVPTAFKKARVIPILKKPALDPSDISNYRPVSLLSFLSKILERVVCNQLSDYLMQNNLHDPNQSGFKVNHKTLLSTLRSLGICGTAWEWFASYLDGRSYQVTWKGLTSAPRRLSTGVPQGSVLGPLLFSLYTHSLGKVISSHGFSYHCYADDTQLIFSFPPSDTTASARISACLADISSWMTAHQLKLNPSKTELLIIPGDPSPAQDLTISLNNSMISPSATACNLGVTMDNQLSFSSHVTNVTHSCRFLLYNIRRIRPFLSTQATQVLVQSLVISRLDYCNSLLAALLLNAIRPLQMIKNAAARLVFNLPKFSHTTPLLRSLHWLPVAARIRFKTLMLAYKVKNGPAPSYLKALITPRTAPRSLRSTSTARLVPPSLREKKAEHFQKSTFTMFEIFPTIIQNINKRVRSCVEPQIEGDYQWSCVFYTDNEFKQVPLIQVFIVNWQSSEFKEVERYVKEIGLLQEPLKAVYRVQNVDLWELYCKKKSQLMRIKGQSDIEEQMLFHGTGKNNLHNICLYNFDCRLSNSKRHGHVLGKGTYFALHAAYANMYSRSHRQQGDKTQIMFLARVIVGKYRLGDSDFCKPDGDQNENLHDSCVDDTLYPRIFVVFDSNQIYPEYVLEYGG
ncbi:hypothetical protein QTP70_012612 [Hemibagrus guttatus]|uniref:Poly [ADP-ribose] polymerase n=1 Tax=Hemibagrus guttatus TaxID=175788 RepID=A0AAE0QBP3_9TELE|nr:hypothetical protein QTP70_012612 [Hemibagrus guttatus]